MSELNDMSIILTKAKKSGFFEDVKAEELDFLKREARSLFSTDTVLGNRNRGIDIVSEFGIPVATSVGSAIDSYPLGLSAAVSAVSSLGGELFLRAGVYRTDTRLFLKQGTVLRGEGMDATTLYITAAAFNANVSNVLIKDMTIMGNDGAARQVFQNIVSSGAKNWRFENVKFVNIGVRMARMGAIIPDGSALTTGCGIDEHIEFDRCEFTGWTEDGMVWAQGVDNVTINRSRIHTIGTDVNKGDAVKFSYGSKYGRVLHNDFYSLQRDAVDLYDAHSVDVIGNKMRNVAVCAVESKFEDGGPNSIFRIRVHDNTAINCGSALTSNAPVFQLASSDISAKGNLIDGTPGAGFRVGPAMNNASRQSTDGNWQDNRAYGCAGHGFILTGSARHIIRNNIAKNNLGSGFYVPASTNSTPLGNASDNISFGNSFADTWMV